MAHFQKEQISTVVFGLLTDSESWEFFRIDENHKVWKSRVYTYQFTYSKKEIWQFLHHLIETSQAEKLSPSSTAYASQIELFEDKEIR